MITTDQRDQDLTGAKMGDMRGRQLVRCHLADVKWGRVEELHVRDCTGIEKNTVFTCWWRNGFKDEGMFRVLLHNTFSVPMEKWPDRMKQ